jgi:hypothetical protein
MQAQPDESLRPQSFVNILPAMLNPLFKRYKVDAYFSGHDHALELIERNGVSHVINGAGSLFSTFHDVVPGTQIAKVRSWLIV